MTMFKKLTMPFLSTILIVMSGCATNGIAPVASDYCKIAGPITYDSTKDSPETVKAVEAHNSQFACVCQSDCPKDWKNDKPHPGSGVQP